MLVALFTTQCGHFKQVWALRTLVAEREEDRKYFSKKICRIIIYQVLKDAWRCFSKKLTPSNFHNNTGTWLRFDDVPVVTLDLQGL